MNISRFLIGPEHHKSTSETNMTAASIPSLLTFKGFNL